MKTENLLPTVSLGIFAYDFISPTTQFGWDTAVSLRKPALVAANP